METTTTSQTPDPTLARFFREVLESGPIDILDEYEQLGDPEAFRFDEVTELDRDMKRPELAFEADVAEGFQTRHDDLLGDFGNEAMLIAARAANSGLGADGVFTTITLEGPTPEQAAAQLTRLRRSLASVEAAIRKREDRGDDDGSLQAQADLCGFYREKCSCLVLICGFSGVMLDETPAHTPAVAKAG